MNPRVMTILWPSFVMAGVLEGMVFSVVDPAEMRWLGHVPIDASPQAINHAAARITSCPAKACAVSGDQPGSR